MSTTYNVKRIIVGALLAAPVALAGFGLSMGTAQALTHNRNRRGRSVASTRNLTRRSRYRRRG